MVAVTQLPRVECIGGGDCVWRADGFNVGRMIAAMAMVTSSVEPSRRGAFLSANSSLQHVASGFGAYLGGIIITENADGPHRELWHRRLDRLRRDDRQSVAGRPSAPRGRSRSFRRDDQSGGSRRSGRRCRRTDAQCGRGNAGGSKPESRGLREAWAVPRAAVRSGLAEIDCCGPLKPVAFSLMSRMAAADDPALDARYEAVVIGAGAAGLLAATRLAELGRRTLLLEKNRKPGRQNPDLRRHSLQSDPRLRRARHHRGIWHRPASFCIRRWPRSRRARSVALFEAEGVPTYVEAGTGKIFPAKRSGARRRRGARAAARIGAARRSRSASRPSTCDSAPTVFASSPRGEPSPAKNS